MKKTKLVAPALREAQAERTVDLLREVGGLYRETLRTLSTEERCRRALKAERRTEHDLSTPPERAAPLLEARFGWSAPRISRSRRMALSGGDLCYPFDRGGSAADALHRR